jgi:molybdopterin-synthase adenylyltransferase
LKEHIEGWREQGSGWVVILVTEDENGDNHFSAWAVSRDQAVPVPLDLVEDDSPRLAPLMKSWPITTLIDKRVGVLGVGSIGSATAQALVSYGVGKIVLVDPDRLLWHNLARHQLPARYVGLNKANAMADWLLERDPKLVVCGFDLDVIEDADALRTVLPELDCIITTTDGVESRQAANHLAVRAGLPNVLACVLDNGSYSEVIRVVPGRTACLWCYRQTQIAAGGFNPEPSLDRGYGEGTRHLPMTAVTGDLMLVGNAAAKVAVATVLERYGRRDQRLPGDLCITGLQPNPSRRAPFDIQRAGESRWHDIGGPGTDCPTCQPTAIK